MKAQPKGKISYMLVEAYHRLGINNVWELDARSKEALEYLGADREHYIEVADPDTPEYLITTKFGVICKLIPLAREIKNSTSTRKVTTFIPPAVEPEAPPTSIKTTLKAFDPSVKAA